MHVTFELFAFRFHFVARGPLCFPPGKAGNVLRGALGTIFRKIACVPQCPGARTCERRATCAYARLFEPSAVQAGPSGLADWPRPFVIRAGHLDGRSLPAGDPFHFDLHLFELHDPALAYFVLSFAQLARAGLGAKRAPAELQAVDQLDARAQVENRVYADGKLLAHAIAPPVTLSLDPEPAPIRRVGMRFLTPTELKAGSALVRQPEFGVLFARIRDRISTLRQLYGSGPLPVDFRALGEAAQAVRLTCADLRWENVTRRSSRTGQTHPLGGFVGEVEYEGNLTAFLPYLRAAAWTGVGRHTVWGKGQVEIVFGA